VPIDAVRADREARLCRLADARGELAYLARKQIHATDGAFVIQGTQGRDPEWWPFAGWPCRDGTICLPARDAAGRLWTMQYIDPDGAKRFEPNGFKRGCFHVIGGQELRSATALIIAEGYATATTIRETLQDSRIAVVAGFDSGNLPEVAKALRTRFPRMPLVVAGDNDARLLQRPPYKNVGLEKAQAAAEAVKGIAVTPIFPPGTSPERTDYNDLATLGPSQRAAVSRQLRAALERARIELRTNVDVRHRTVQRGARA
jgi:putative DNA primase/helicase